jgi:hypothetical protein
MGGCFSTRCCSEEGQDLLVQTFGPPVSIPRHFHDFLKLPPELQDLVFSFCRDYDFRSICRSICARIPEKPSIIGNVGLGLYRRYFHGPWEGEVAFSMIMSELRDHIDITTFQHSQQLVLHMDRNNAHPPLIQLLNKMHLPQSDCTIYLPHHFEQRSVFEFIYRSRLTIQYV